MKPLLGQISAKAVTNCPCCHQKIEGPISALAVDHVFDGENWIALDSWEGHALAMRMIEMGIPDMANHLEIWLKANRARRK
jgi:hypothetical protein